MAGKFEGKVALVTGASSGIGAATAAALIREGARVAVTARRVDRLKGLGKALGVDSKNFLAIEADVRSEADAERLIKDTVAWGGKLDLLVNNAGLSRGGLLEQANLDDVKLMLDTNVFALMNLARLAIPHLKATKGDLINVASTIVKSMGAGSAVYAATKAAVVAFSECLRKEMIEDGVRVMILFPGIVETEFFDGFTGEKRQAMAKLVQAVEPLQGQDLGDAVVFMASRPHHATVNELVMRPTKQA